MQLPRDLQHFIGGRWVDSNSNERFPILNPATEETLGTIPRGTTDDVDRAVSAARAAYEEGKWSRMEWRERSRILRRVGELMMQRADELARTETLNQGRPIRQSREMVVPQSAGAWDFFASTLMNHTGHAATPVPWATGFTIKQPIGVVGCITPGNVPLVLASEKMAPALATGNSVVFKPPPDCPLSSTLLVECIAEAGVPAGVINMVLGDGPTVGRAMAEHPGIGMIAFTGSTETGKEIMRLATGNVKRLFLELGGKAPMVVFADADIEGVVEGAVWGAYLNGGQVCMAATRILVQDAVFDAFTEQFVARTRALRIGPGIEPSTELGPMLNARIRDRVEDYITRGREAGATVLCGGEPLRDGDFAKGFWVQPTVFTDVLPNMEIVRDEIFGPVPIIQRFATMEEAIHLANDTPYGLTGSVWTRDVNTALKMAEEVRAGYVWINDHLVLAPGFPFGGWQQSGFGREASAQTLDEFSNTKTVHFDRTGMAIKPRYRLLCGDEFSERH